MCVGGGNRFFYNCWVLQVFCTQRWGWLDVCFLGNKMRLGVFVMSQLCVFSILFNIFFFCQGIIFFFTYLVYKVGMFVFFGGLRSQFNFFRYFFLWQERFFLVTLERYFDCGFFLGQLSIGWRFLLFLIFCGKKSWILVWGLGDYVFFQNLWV